MLRIPIITALCVLCLVCTAAAQQRNGADSVAVRAVMNGTQLMPSITLPIVEVVDRLPKRLRKERERWTRLRNAVYVTYSYARSAGRVLKDVN